VMTAAGHSPYSSFLFILPLIGRKTDLLPESARMVAFSSYRRKVSSKPATHQIM
jgi:hypothetical protein